MNEKCNCNPEPFQPCICNEIKIMIEKYRPSNGSEGMSFINKWCGPCRKHGHCHIQYDTMYFYVDDEKWPEDWSDQWRICPATREAVCTDFEADK